MNPFSIFLLQASISAEVGGGGIKGAPDKRGADAAC